MNVFAKNKQTLRQQNMAMKRWLFGKTCRTLFVALFFVFGFLYLLQTSAVSGRGYELGDLESKVRDLKRETQRLDVEIASYRSMRSIQERLQGMDMVAADSVEYVSAGGRVAAR